MFNLIMHERYYMDFYGNSIAQTTAYTFLSPL